jgi:putative ABC transport system permease protein
VFTCAVSLPDVRYRTPESRIAFYREFDRRLETLPGVRTAGSVDWLPVQGRYHPWGFRWSGLAANEDVTADADVRVVAGDYFAAAGIDLVRGRLFSDMDGPNAPRVAILSRSAAAAYRDRDVIGKRIDVLGRREWEIVGIVADVAYDANGTTIPMVYLPHDQFAENRNWQMSQLVAWRGNYSGVVESVRAEIEAMDPALAVFRIKPMKELVAGTLGRQRFTLLLMSVFAGAALLLAMVGLYGVLAYIVREQTREIGIRMVLGARRAQVMTFVLGRAGLMVAVGVAVGSAAALALTGWLRTLLFGVSVTDPWVFALAVGGLLVAAAAAAYVPARRAVRLDPLGAIRQE